MVLSNTTYPPHVRVDRELRDLRGDGHRLFLMARQGLGQARAETVNGVHVIRVPLPCQRHKPLAELIYYFWQRYIIYFHIRRACGKHRIDALHVHDLPYALATTLAGEALRLPVIFDMHEHYTDVFRAGMRARHGRLTIPLFALLLALFRREERCACRAAHRVIVVAREHIPRLRRLGAPAERILEVTNAEDIDHFAGLPLRQDLLDRYRDDFVLTYFGGFDALRGLETVIQAMPLLLKQVPNVRLLLVGSGYLEAALHALAEQLGLGDRVVFPGYQPAALLPTYVELSAVGVIPHVATPAVEMTMPNKIFQFMMLGKPVLVSNVPPLVRVVRDADCGLVFRQRDPDSFAAAVCQLRDPQLRRRLGENGRRAVYDRYNWRQVVQPLLQVYRDLERRPAAAPNVAPPGTCR